MNRGVFNHHIIQINNEIECTVGPTGARNFFLNNINHSLIHFKETNKQKERNTLEIFHTFFTAFKKAFHDKNIDYPSHKTMLTTIHGPLLLATSLLLIFPAIALVPFSLGNSHSSITSSRTSVTSTIVYYTSVDTDEGKLNRGQRRPSRKWEEMVLRLRQYRSTHGHTIVQPSDDPELHGWIKNLRKNYRHQFRNDTTQVTASYRSQLPPDKWETLQELEFCWEPKTLQWETSFQELCLFQKKFGHCHATRKDYRKDYPKLCNFVQNQRREYTFFLEGNRTQLTMERIQRLNSIGLEWFKSHEMVWEKRYQQLDAFYREYNHCHVPQGFSKNPQLGSWCMNQRTAYRFYQNGEQTALTQERIDKLKALHFQWHYREYKWMDKFERLKSYQAEHTHLHIGSSDTENTDLRIWLIFQRLFYHRRRRNESARMTDHRIEMLESIPNFSWRGGQHGKGPSKEDWSQLFVAIRGKGITPGQKAKEHWFEGMDPFEKEVKNVWTEEELVELWNQEEDDEDEIDVYEDEQTRKFLQSEGP
jgi:hypothetical protein